MHLVVFTIEIIGSLYHQRNSPHLQPVLQFALTLCTQRTAGKPKVLHYMKQTEDFTTITRALLLMMS